MGYLLWIDQERLAKREPLAAVGLEGLLFHDAKPAVTRLTKPGPSGHIGIILSWPLRSGHAAGLEPVYQPERQTWIPNRVENPTFWLGWPKDQRPIPENLARKRQYPGTPVRLEDGNTWVVPIASALPQRYGIADDGRWVSRIHPDFHRFCLETARVAETLSPVGEQTLESQMTVGDCLEYASLALSLNYRVNREIVSLLELLGTETLPLVVGAPLELELRPVMAQGVQKKTAVNTPASSST